MPSQDMPQNEPWRKGHRGAMSLLELLAAVGLIGLVAAACIVRLGSGTIDNVAAEGVARKLAFDLQQARRRTIASGENHLLELTTSGGQVTSYLLSRRSGGSLSAEDSVREIPGGVTVTSSHSGLEFAFDGTSLASYALNVAGPNRSWQIQVIPTTGTPLVAEIVPP